MDEIAQTCVMCYGKRKKLLYNIVWVITLAQAIERTKNVPNLLLLVGEHALRLLISLSKRGLICRPLHLHKNANVSFIGLTQLNVKLLNDFSSIHSNLAAHCQGLKKSNYRVTILIFVPLREMNQ